MPKISGAERVRKHRARRKNFGIVEIRIWVKAEDKKAALDAVSLFKKAAQNHMARRLHYDRDDDIPTWLRSLL